MNKTFKRFLQYSTLAASILGATVSPVLKDLSPRKSNEGDRQYYPIEQTNIIAHRGGEKGIKQNTLDAFHSAREIGADAVEFDIRQSGDRRLVVYHNPKIRGRQISSLSYTQVNDLASREGIHIPTVEEALVSLRGKRVIADLKERGYEQEVVKTLMRDIPKEDLIISSTFPESLRRIKEIDPDIKTSLVLPSGPQYLKTNTRKLLGILPWQDLRTSQADYVSVNGSNINSRFYQNAMKGDASVLVYGVDNKQEEEKLLRNPAVAGIITYNPKQVLELKSSLINSGETKNNPPLETRVSFNILAIGFFLIFLAFLFFNPTGNVINSGFSSKFNLLFLFLLVILIIFYLLKKRKTPQHF